jgi:hypothetical protein
MSRPLTGYCARVVRHSEHDRLVAASLAGIGGHVQMRTVDKDRLFAAVRLDRGGANDLRIALLRCSHSYPACWGFRGRGHGMGDLLG